MPETQLLRAEHPLDDDDNHVSDSQNYRGPSEAITRGRMGKGRLLVTTASTAQPTRFGPGRGPDGGRPDNSERVNKACTVEL